MAVYLRVRDSHSGPTIHKGTSLTLDNNELCVLEKHMQANINID